MKRKIKILLILFVFHNTLNCGFYKGLLRGKYGPFRIFQMLLGLYGPDIIWRSG